MATGSSKQALKDFAKTLNLTHNPFENMAENISLEECHAVLRSVVQNETPLRFAMLEGNHRMECLVRLFYGVGFQEISVPRFGSTFEHHEMITKGSVMYKETHVRLCENPEANGLIYNSDLVRLREFSEHLTSKRKQLVQSSWGHLLIDCVTKVSQLPAWKAHLSSASVVWSEKVPTSVKLFSNTKWGEQQKQTAKWLLEYMLKVEPTVTDKALEPTSGGLSNFDASMAKYDMRVLFCPYTSLQNGTPDFNQAKRNLKIKCFKSIKPSVIMWLVQVFGSHKEAFKILQEFLQVPHGYMKDLDFLALYVCGPVNKITEMMLHATCTELEKQGLLKMKGKNLTKHATVDKQRLEHYIRVSYAISYLQTLTKLRMNWNFAPGSKNSILRTWMGKGDLGFDPSSKNMLRNEKALCYDNDIKILLSTFVKYVEHKLQKKTLIGSHYHVSQWWNRLGEQGSYVVTVAKKIFPSLRRLDDDNAKFDARRLFDEDYIETLIPPCVRLNIEYIVGVHKGSVDLTRIFKQTDFMSLKERIRWMKEKSEAALSNYVDEETKRAIMDSYDQKADRIQQTIRVAHIDFAPSSDESAGEESKKVQSPKQSPTKTLSQKQLTAFERISKEVQSFVSESPAKTTTESRKLQMLIQDFTSYTTDLASRFKVSTTPAAKPNTFEDRIDEIENPHGRSSDKEELRNKRLQKNKRWLETQKQKRKTEEIATDDDPNDDDEDSSDSEKESEGDDDEEGEEEDEDENEDEEEEPNSDPENTDDDDDLDENKYASEDEEDLKDVDTDNITDNNRRRTKTKTTQKPRTSARKKRPTAKAIESAAGKHERDPNESEVPNKRAKTNTTTKTKNKQKPNTRSKGGATAKPKTRKPKATTTKQATGTNKQPDARKRKKK